MKRRILVFLVATLIMVGVAALTVQQPRGLLVLDWAKKAPPETPPAAILIEMGLQDYKTFKPRDWSGRASVAGAKVVLREGYRFRPSEGDKLIAPDGWQASSHRGLRVPPKNPAVAKLEPIATIGVVLHLADVKDGATLTVETNDSKLAAKVSLKEVLAGRAQALWDGDATVRLVSTATPVATGKTEDDFPAACYGPDGTLWVAYVSYAVRDDSRRIEQRPYKEQPKSFKDLYTPEFADQVWVKSYRGGKWSKPMAVTGPKESIARCAIAAEGNGDVWVTYSAFREGKHNLFTRPIGAKYSLNAIAGTVGVGPEQRLTKGAGPDLTPVMCTDQDGNLRAFYQTFSERGVAPFAGRPSPTLVFGMFECRGGKWSRNIAGISAHMIPHEFFGSWGNNWHLAAAVSPKGQVVVAYDSYGEGDYDVGFEVESSQTYRPVAASSKFEARPSVCYDVKGRLWIAYEEGPEQWGKDYGAQDSADGSPLYSSRSVRVICLGADGKLYRPAAELLTSKVEVPQLPFDAVKTNKYEKDPRYAYPRIGIDGKGRIWLTYRQNSGSRYTSHPGAIWRTYARRLDGDRWSEPIEIHHSDGLLDDRPVLLPHNNGGLIVIHNTDGRYTTPDTIDNQIYLSYVNLPGEPVEPTLVAHDPGKKDPKLEARAKGEGAAVKRIRDYRVKAGGKTYQLLRGEYHRHTEISWDGSPDGSLEDMFRYAIDAAAMDWIGNGDHDNGAGREYSWWLTQKFSDAYHVPGRFTPMFTYERSVAYPHGHRNVMFAQRGVRTLPRLAAPADEKAVAGVHADDTKMLYRYLRELGGICAVHTSATGMGTDWRDNDPVVEPIVEIYQGDRMSYEREGAPRAGYEQGTGKEPINVAGWYPKGFVNLALGKGYKLSFQASSDHWSTHISYFIILAECNDRAALLDAVKKRHCYGATDAIILDVRSGNYVMGDEFKTKQAPALDLNVIGTGKLAKIDILRDSEVIHTIKPAGSDYRGTWTDPAPLPGAHYYYVRVLQADDEIAWGSPMWINYVK